MRNPHLSPNLTLHFGQLIAFLSFCASFTMQLSQNVCPQCSNTGREERWEALALGPYTATEQGMGNKLIEAETNGRHFADDIFKSIFLNENVWIPIKISLKFVPKGPINNNPALLQVMAWRRPGDKPLSEPMMVRLPTHICVSRPQWVNSSVPGRSGWNFR